MTTISLSAEAKMALAVLGSFEHGVQINISPKSGVSVSTRFTPLVKAQSADLSAAVMDCASQCRDRAMAFIEDPFYTKSMNELVHMLSVLPGIAK